MFDIFLNHRLVAYRTDTFGVNHFIQVGMQGGFYI